MKKITLSALYAVWLLLLSLAFAFTAAARQTTGHPWSGTLTNAESRPLVAARVQLRSVSADLQATTDENGIFRFPSVAPGTYTLRVSLQGVPVAPATVEITPVTLESRLTLAASGALLLEMVAADPASSGGEHLTGRETSQLPLNKRDFSQLLLLAAGTMTDTNGATNFTAQFAVNGQRGVEAVFAMDGADSSDPEMGGAAFSNFNVDAVSEIQSSSGWMPAEIGRGAAGFSNILTRSGSDTPHGSLFEFVRNSAFDARNFFDKQSAVNPGRIPPFRRNEFGLTLGGPVVLPFLYDGHGRTFFYAQYQGFRQVLGTTQVLPVPTLDERAGRNTTAFPGDTLLVPVDPQIRSVLNRY